jgi:hypothetical protein
MLPNIKMRLILILILFFYTSLSAYADSERNLNLNEIILEKINIKGARQTWKFDKVCIDGQAYLINYTVQNILMGVAEFKNMTALFKNGVPETCQIKN